MLHIRGHLTFDCCGSAPFLAQGLAFALARDLLWLLLYILALLFQFLLHIPRTTQPFALSR